jgi:hypothetical protein
LGIYIGISLDERLVEEKVGKNPQGLVFRNNKNYSGFSTQVLSYHFEVPHLLD